MKIAILNIKRLFQISTRTFSKKRSKQNPEQIKAMSNELKELLSKLQEKNKIQDVDETKLEQVNNVFPDHYPVFYKEILKRISENNRFKETINSDFIATKTDFLIGDFTFGLGNLTSQVLKTFSNSNVLGVDIDNKVLNISKSKEELNNYIINNRLKLINENYAECELILNTSKKLGRIKSLTPYFSKFKINKKLDYAIIDLGYNSFQISK